VKSLGADAAEVRVGYTPPPGGSGPATATPHGFANVENQKDIDTTIKKQDWSSTVRDDIVVKPNDPTQTASFQLTRAAENVAIIIPPLNLLVPPPPSLVDAVYHGAPVEIVFEQGYGTCVPGYIYHGQYNNLSNAWTVTGYNTDDKGISTYSYAVGPSGKGNLDVWEALFTFDDNGIFYDQNGTRRIGTIRLRV
jgi:hypothetical protein